MKKITQIKKLTLDWENHYKETAMEALHWYSEEVDPEVAVAIKKFCPSRGSALDLGTGPGTMAIELTKLGYNVTATDISESAINMAKARAGDLADRIKFIVDDVRESKVEGKFDLIHDRGCLHVLDADGIKKYLSNISRLLNDGGILLLKTFSIEETRADGPNRYSPELIKSYFEQGFELLHHEETIYPSTLPVDPKALFCVLRKRLS